MHSYLSSVSCEPIWANTPKVHISYASTVCGAWLYGILFVSFMWAKRHIFRREARRYKQPRTTAGPASEPKYVYIQPENAITICECTSWMLQCLPIEMSKCEHSNSVQNAWVNQQKMSLRNHFKYWFLFKINVCLMFIYLSVLLIVSAPLSLGVSACLSVCLSICLHACKPICQPVSLNINPSINWSILMMCFTTWWCISYKHSCATKHTCNPTGQCPVLYLNKVTSERKQHTHVCTWKKEQELSKRMDVAGWHKDTKYLPEIQLKGVVGKRFIYIYS